jgi:hypothetical protein
LFFSFLIRPMPPKADIAVRMSGCNKRGFARSQMTF